MHLSSVSFTARYNGICNAPHNNRISNIGGDSFHHGGIYWVDGHSGQTAYRD